MKVSLVKTSMEIDIVSPREESDGLYSSSAIGEWRGGGRPMADALGIRKGSPSCSHLQPPRSKAALSSAPSDQ